MTGRELQRTRKRLRWSTAECGRALGVSARTVENWEQDRPKRGIPEGYARLLVTLRVAEYRKRKARRADVD